ncbi:P-loop containing nucleoside triphosphate hydrolase [Pirellulimonas nuda]|uniref:P-loop containing nucleoside triphosphate hydrolase n=1 Tax=Pirellulimonas nuda TaxID=2528009 RepID=A0A518DFF2_9BACT|nr:ABC transporter ATP-binding protein [Pirellulimonas nuda]QDU90211.1 P-loop containing nucleoside triphosphate hydrolase [Pirellulimonas nuda]
MPLLQAIDVRKTYHKGATQVPVLRGVDFSVDAGELVAITGQSGSGKSTLLHLLATLDRPDSGEVRYEGARIDNLRTAARDRLRNRQIGMIFQAYHLLPELSALENVLTPVMLRYGLAGYWRRRAAFRQRASELLERVGLGPRAAHKPRELSGGEMQRTAIARALMAEPKLLLADEPTGNLDQTTGQGVLKILRELNQETGLTVILVTHDGEVSAAADRTVSLVDGRVADGRLRAA